MAQLDSIKKLLEEIAAQDVADTNWRTDDLATLEQLEILSPQYVRYSTAIPEESNIDPRFHRDWNVTEEGQTLLTAMRDQECWDNAAKHSEQGDLDSLLTSLIECGKQKA